jgi:hypothetical protein
VRRTSNCKHIMCSPIPSIPNDAGIFRTG